MKGQEEGKKKDYLIAKALHQFMWASILASLASQIAMTTDAIVVSQFIGPEAISAINLTMPVVIFFNFLMMLFGMGGSVLVAKSLGERDIFNWRPFDRRKRHCGFAPSYEQGDEIYLP